MRFHYTPAARTLGLGALAALALALALAYLPAYSAAAADATAIPASQARLQLAGEGERARTVLAGGCFWGMGLVFSHVEGVTNVVSGYAGGTRAHANYADSSSGRYDDAEAVRITYDPSRIGYAELLRIYFSVAHDPTQVNRQGPDVGSQYRSEIFATSADQARVARAYIRQLEAAQVFDAPIATEVSTGEASFPAESWHQNYAREHPSSRYIRVNDLPKLRALKTRYPQHYTKEYATGA